MTTGRDAKIAPTAHYTAYAWKHLGMPHAEHFATAKGALMFWGFRAAGEWATALLPGVPTMGQYLATRHLLIDRRLLELRPDVVIELGAGLSRRGVTFAADLGVRYLEIDLPHMAEAKRRRLEASPASLRARLEGLLSVESHDILAPSFADRLARALEGAKRPVIVSEGVIGYFPIDERVQLARTLSKALRRAGGGRYLTDLRDRDGSERVQAAANVLKAGISLVTRGRGAAEDFASGEAVARFFAHGGFDEAEIVGREGLGELSRVGSPARVWMATVR